MSKSIRRYFTPYRLITNLLVFIFSFTCLFPLVWMGYTSLKTNQEYTQSSLALPEALNFSNYYNVLVQANYSNWRS